MQVSHHVRTVETIECSNCVMCSEHEHLAPRVRVRTHYVRVLKSGERQEITKEEFDRRMEGPC